MKSVYTMFHHSCSFTLVKESSTDDDVPIIQTAHKNSNRSTNARKKKVASKKKPSKSQKRQPQSHPSEPARANGYFSGSVLMFCSTFMILCIGKLKHPIILCCIFIENAWWKKEKFTYPDLHTEHVGKSSRLWSCEEELQVQERIPGQFQNADNECLVKLFLTPRFSLPIKDK